MALSYKPWGNVSAGNYKDGAAYVDACLVSDAPPGTKRDALVKGNGHLPVYEPDGNLNVNAMHAAAASLAGARGGVKLSPELKRKAASRLVGLYRSAKLDPPASLLRLAGP